MEGKENVLSIINRLWRLLKFLTKWSPKSWKLCNFSFKILTIFLYEGKDYKKFGCSLITAAIYSSFFVLIKRKVKIKTSPRKVNSCLNNLQTFHWNGSINNKIHFGEAVADCFWIHNHKNLTGTTLMYWNIYLYMSLGCAYLLLFAAEPKVEGLGRHCEV